MKFGVFGANRTVCIIESSVLWRQRFMKFGILGTKRTVRVTEVFLLKLQGCKKKKKETVVGEVAKLIF